MGARDMRRACRSVFATTNSMPSMPESIMRFTALPPPPPTPMTLILASLRASSLKLMRMSFSFFIAYCPSVDFVHAPLKPLTTKDTKVHKGFRDRFSLCTFVSFVVHALDLCSLFCEQTHQSRTPAGILQAAGNSRAMAVKDHSQ